MSNLAQNQKDFKKKLLELKRESYVRECFHKDEKCSEKIISAHSIQNNKILKKSQRMERFYASLSIKMVLNLCYLKQGEKKQLPLQGFASTMIILYFQP